MTSAKQTNCLYPAAAATDGSLLHLAIFGVNDLHVHHAGAQVQELQVIPDHCR